ncbi:MAG: MoaD family protein [Halobacteriota archaeon]|nr:MoaD family protein [Halobacteriota archaeon]
MVTVKVFSSLRDITDENEFEIEARSVRELLKKSSKIYGREFRAAIRKSSILVNGRDVRHLKGPLKLNEDDEVCILPPAFGG